MAKAVKATKKVKESKTKSVLSAAEHAEIARKINKYELMFILSPMLTEDMRKKALAEFDELLKEHKAEVFHIDDWGKRDLAYRIKKFDEGYYLIYYFTLPDSTVIPTIEQHLRLDQNFIRHLLLKREPEHEIKDYTIEEPIEETADKSEKKTK
jgi:small subunit ribosomal protein S6